MFIKIMIDSDASPVKDIVIDEAKKHRLKVVLVASYSHYSTKIYPHHVETIYVDSAKEAADYRIMQLLQKNDILITQDYGLASLALGKKAKVLHHKGFEYDNDNIANLLESRYISAQIRKSGKRTKGPKPFTKEDADTFRRLLNHTLAK